MATSHKSNDHVKITRDQAQDILNAGTPRGRPKPGKEQLAYVQSELSRIAAEYSRVYTWDGPDVPSFDLLNDLTGISKSIVKLLDQEPSDTSSVLDLHYGLYQNTAASIAALRRFAKPQLYDGYERQSRKSRNSKDWALNGAIVAMYETIFKVTVNSATVPRISFFTKCLEVLSPAIGKKQNLTKAGVEKRINRFVKERSTN